MYFPRSTIPEEIELLVVSLANSNIRQLRTCSCDVSVNQDLGLKFVRFMSTLATHASLFSGYFQVLVNPFAPLFAEKRVLKLVEPVSGEFGPKRA